MSHMNTASPLLHSQVANLHQQISLVTSEHGQSHVSHSCTWSTTMNQSCHIWTRPVPCSTLMYVFYNYDSVMSHINASCPILRSQVHNLHLQISHVTYEHGQYYEWVMSHMNAACRILRSHVHRLQLSRAVPDAVGQSPPGGRWNYVTHICGARGRLPHTPHQGVCATVYTISYIYVYSPHICIYVYIYKYVCIYICMYIYLFKVVIYVCAYTFICVCIYIYVYIYVGYMFHVYICICICMYMYLYVYVYVYVYVCIYICIYIYRVHSPYPWCVRPTTKVWSKCIYTHSDSCMHI